MKLFRCLSGLSLFAKPYKLVISTTDLDAALEHLNSYPMSLTAELPKTWGRQQLISWIEESIPKRVKLGDSFQVQHRVWGHVVPLGVEFLNFRLDTDKVQVILSIRKHNTDLENLMPLNSVK